MTSEWIVTEFDDAIDFQEGPGILAKDFHDHGVPLVRLSGLDRGKSLLNGCNYLNPELVAKKWAHFALQKGDILLSTSASLGRIAVVDREAVGAVAYTGIVRMRPRDSRLFAPFIRYLLEGPNFQQQAEAFGAGSVIRHFGPMHLRQMTVMLPPPNEQRAIAHILGKMDERIELNRKQNETLEAIAGALFKAWFVDFEPVRAKLKGRWDFSESLPGLPTHLYRHFPDRLIESKLGEIPEGWEMRSLDSIANYLNGLAMQKFPPESEINFLPVIKIAQLRAGNTSGADRASTQIKPEYIINDGDVLFSWSGSLEVEVWNGGRGALNQHLFKITSKLVPKWFYFYATRYHLESFRAIAAGKATTMGHIQRKHLSDAMIAVAPSQDMKIFDAVIGPIFDQIVSNEQQSRSLALLRNALLPRLISGELRLENPEAFTMENCL